MSRTRFRSLYEELKLRSSCHNNWAVSLSVQQRWIVGLSIFVETVEEVEHRFLRLPYTEKSTGDIGLQILPLETESLSKEERASTFLYFPVIGKLPGIFSLLTVERLKSYFQFKSDRSFHG